MKQYFNNIHYSTEKNSQDSFLRLLLDIFSLFYFVITYIRNYFYKVKVLKTTKLNACIISIGNLTTGGTGKTPLTIEIAKYIKNNYDKKIAILSRGYGGQLSGDVPNLVSDGEKIYLSAEMAGDEPYLMANNLKEVSVLTGKSRINSGNFAITNLDSEILILDDGFQHIKLERDLNILVIDIDKKFGNNKLLPAGPLRESIQGIERADHIIFIDKIDNDILPAKKNFIKKISNQFNKPYSIARFIHAGIYNIKTLEEIKSDINDIYVFTGIAQPESFINNLKKLGYNIKYTNLFPDHHLYSKDDIENVIEEAINENAQCIITTEKDSVKLMPYLNKINSKIPVYALKITIDIDLEKIITQDLVK